MLLLPLLRHCIIPLLLSTFGSNVICSNVFILFLSNLLLAPASVSASVSDFLSVEFPSFTESLRLPLPFTALMQVLVLVLVLFLLYGCRHASQNLTSDGLRQVQVEQVHEEVSSLIAGSSPFSFSFSLAVTLMLMLSDFTEDTFPLLAIVFIHSLLPALSILTHPSSPSTSTRPSPPPLSSSSSLAVRSMTRVSQTSTTAAQYPFLLTALAIIFLTTSVPSLFSASSYVMVSAAWVWVPFKAFLI